MSLRQVIIALLSLLTTGAADAADGLVLEAHGNPTALVALDEALAGARLRDVHPTALRGAEGRRDGADCRPTQTLTDATGEHTVTLPTTHDGRPLLIAHGAPSDVEQLARALPEALVVRSREPWCQRRGCFSAWLPERPRTGACSWDPTERLVLLSRDLSIERVGDACVSQGIAILGPERSNRVVDRSFLLPATGGPGTVQWRFGSYPERVDDLEEECSPTDGAPPDTPAGGTR